MLERGERSSETRELLMRKALVLFLQRSYGSVSVGDLQQETQVSRGAMYHHFKGKEELFRCVIDRYLFPVFRLMPDDDGLEGPHPLRDALERMMTRCEEYVEGLRQITEHKLNDFAFYRLMVQAEEFYDGFSARVKELVEAERRAWQRVLNYAVRAREIHPEVDIDLYITLFSTLQAGLGLHSLFTPTLSMESFRDVYMRVYRTILAQG